MRAPLWTRSCAGDGVEYGPAGHSVVPFGAFFQLRRNGVTVGAFSTMHAAKQSVATCPSCRTETLTPDQQRAGYQCLTCTRRDES